MIIRLTSGAGTGPTKLAAFDAALFEAGIANFNLIILSSIIPGGSKIIKPGNTAKQFPGKWGDKLYVVIADARVDSSNAEAWAGIGWIQDNKTGKGLFVEHAGYSKKSVQESIKASLKALMATRNVDYSPINIKVEGIMCKQSPVCALVVAAYQASGWNDEPS